MLLRRRGRDCLNLADKNVDSDFIDLNDYDLIGIASGVAFGRLYKRIESFVESDRFPCNKSVFILYTCGNRNLKSIHYCDHVKEVLMQKNCTIEGDYGCAGYDTFGPIKLIGGISKGYPDADDIETAKIMYEVMFKDMNGNMIYDMHAKHDKDKHDFDPSLYWDRSFITMDCKRGKVSVKTLVLT